MKYVTCRIAIILPTIAFLFTLVAGMPLLAQTATAPPTQPATTQSEAQTKADGPRVNTAVVPMLRRGFGTRHEAFVEIAKQGDIDLLFMGDSITDWWRSAGRGRRGAPVDAAADGENRPAAGKPVFDKYFGSMKVANFGIAGDTTQGVLWRLQNGEGQGFQPKAVMLMIGTNNTGSNTAEEIAEGVTAVVAELRKDFPNAKILLLGIFPRTNRPEAARKIPEINKIIAKLDDGQHVIYLDIGQKFLAEDGTIPRDIMADGLHPTTKGYEIWAEAVKEPLAKMVAGGAPDR